MAKATVGIQATIAGLTINGTIQRTADGGRSHEIPLPAGTAGTLTTRSGDDTGVATLESGHGLQTSDQVVVFWSGGVRYGMTATVAGDAITVASGQGDNLPAQDTAVVVTKEVVVDSLFEETDLQLIVVNCDQQAAVSFIGASLGVYVDLPAKEVWLWGADQVIANPLTGGIAGVNNIYAANGSSTTAATLLVGILFDTTP